MRFSSFLRMQHIRGQRYSPRIDVAVNHAAHYAAAHSTTIRSSHLLWGLFRTEGSAARAILQHHDVKIAMLDQLVLLSPTAQPLEMVYLQLAQGRHDYIGTEQVLGIILDDEPIAAALSALHLSVSDLKQAVGQVRQ